jgi:hypothetical protein
MENLEIKEVNEFLIVSFQLLETEKNLLKLFKDKEISSVYEINGIKEQNGWDIHLMVKR